MDFKSLVPCEVTGADHPGTMNAAWHLSQDLIRA